jgi:hypothetical protein
MPLTLDQKEALVARINETVFDSATNKVKTSGEWVAITEEPGDIQPRDVARGEVQPRSIYKVELLDGRIVGWPFMSDLEVKDVDSVGNPIEPIDLEDKWIGFGTGRDLQEVLWDGRTEKARQLVQIKEEDHFVTPESVFILDEGKLVKSEQKRSDLSSDELTLIENVFRRP